MTGSDPGSRVEDGDSANIACSVSGGDPAEFNGKLAQGATSFTLRGNVTPGGTGTATGIYYDGKLLMTLESPAETPCIIDVSTPPLEVADGRLWAAFDCPVMTNDPSYACRVSGHVIMENCN